jgi:hypothetical protein
VEHVPLVELVVTLQLVGFIDPGGGHLAILSARMAASVLAVSILILTGPKGPR